jgi:hypothetical protein
MAMNGTRLRYQHLTFLTLPWRRTPFSILEAIRAICAVPYSGAELFAWGSNPRGPRAFGLIVRNPFFGVQVVRETPQMHRSGIAKPPSVSVLH